MARKTTITPHEVTHTFNQEQIGQIVRQYLLDNGFEVEDINWDIHVPQPDRPGVVEQPRVTLHAKGPSSFKGDPQR